ncbi:MAG: hypothetical protein P3W93_010490 [Thermus sp.]|nr:hypothetical protein [Thermus sp.]
MATQYRPSPDSEPQPDLRVLKLLLKPYSERPPEPQDVLFLRRYPKEDPYRPKEVVRPGEGKAPWAFPHRPILWS